MARRANVQEDVLEGELGELSSKLAGVRSELAEHQERIDREREARRMQGRKLTDKLTTAQRLDVLRTVFDRVEVHAQEDGRTRLEFYLLWPRARIIHELPRRWDAHTGLRGLGFD